MKHAVLQEKTKTIVRQKTTYFDKIQENQNKSEDNRQMEWRRERNSGKKPRS